MVQTSELISEPKVHTKRINGVTPSDWIDRSLGLAVMLLAIATDLNVKAKSLTKRLSPSELSKLAVGSLDEARVRAKPATVGRAAI
jgi:hypothetical protein